MKWQPASSIFFRVSCVTCHQSVAIIRSLISGVDIGILVRGLQDQVKTAWASRDKSRSGPPYPNTLLNNLFGSSHTVVQGFLEDRDAAQVGPGEEDAAERRRRHAAIGAPDEARRRPDHRVTPAHHIESF